MGVHTITVGVAFRDALLPELLSGELQVDAAEGGRA